MMKILMNVIIKEVEDNKWNKFITQLFAIKV
jgi:hypothetical protein